MASFQIREDDENQVHPKLNNAKAKLGPQKRTVLGDINSNANRINLRSNKQEIKPISKPTKTFKIHEDVENPKPKQKVAPILPDKPQETTTAAPQLPKPKKPSEEEINEKDDALLDAVSKVPQRQPLKDLKPVVDEVEDTEEMSVSFEESPEHVSPMSLESVRISSPLVRHSKPSLQVLYDMEVYRKDIFEYLLQAEHRQRPKPLYMRKQPDVSYGMRSILVDWLVEVVEEYKLQTETLYLAVSFIDRFLSVMSVVKGKLQLLGTAAMFVASKYEEIYPPDVGEFVYITDDTYNKKQVLRMEQLILKVLSFDVSVPTINTFLQHIAVECNLSMRLTNLAQYLCELTLLEGDPYLAFTPSVIACSALAVARHCLDYDDVWPSMLSDSTGYSLHNLAPCVVHLNVTHSRASTLPQQAICDKYKNQKWQKVSEVSPKSLRIL